MKYICDSCEKYPCTADVTKLMLYCPAYSPKPKPITVYDQIHAMDVDEFAFWLSDIAGWLSEYEGKVHPILEWLKQEARE